MEALGERRRAAAARLRRGVATSPPVDAGPAVQAKGVATLLSWVKGAAAGRLTTRGPGWEEDRS